MMTEERERVSDWYLADIEAAISTGRWDIGQAPIVRDLVAEIRRQRARIARLEAALRVAKETIHGWHGMDECGAWDIYDRCSPEMKQINEALGSDAEAMGEKRQ